MTIEELRNALKEKKIIFGTERTIKNLKMGKISQVFISSNCPKKVKEDIKYYVGLGKVKVTELKESNEELGVICKKPFSISVLCY